VLGWIETVVKLAAIAVAVVTAASGGRWHVPRTHAPAFWMITAISIGYFGTVIDRWLDKEVVRSDPTPVSPSAPRRLVAVSRSRSLSRPWTAHICDGARST
jgi:hypothetical protein